MIDLTKPLWKDTAFVILMILVVLSLVHIYLNGIKFGIDFVGGTRIPMTLERPADSATMDQMLSIIKKRVSSFGLVQVNVYARGDNEIIVELPSSDEETIKRTEELLSQPGNFKGIIDGKIAVTDEDIYPGTIHYLSATQLRMPVGGWGVGFTVTSEGAKKFSEAALGKGNKPVYLFLDRPDDSYMFVYMSQLTNSTNVSEEDVLTMVNDALRLEGDDIKLYLLDNFDSYKDTLKPRDDHTKAIVPDNIPDDIISVLEDKGFKIKTVPSDQMTPDYSISPSYSAVSRWDVIGLISAPKLSPDIAQGTVSYYYEITGAETGATDQEKARNAVNEAKKIASVLQGGALPIPVNVESKTSISAPLGSEFLKMSIIGGVVAVIIVAIFISLRYKKMVIILPVLFESACELIILIAVIGSFTIDLGAFAGIIAAVGTSVDDQIVITDELLKKDTHEKSVKLKRAFSIVTMTRTIAIVAMLPLLFSGITEIIGFATSTMIGALLGVLISRRAFAAIIGRLI